MRSRLFNSSTTWFGSVVMGDQLAAVAVAGSVHMDLIATADRLPRRGETRSGHTFAMRPSGEGGIKRSKSRCKVSAPS